MKKIYSFLMIICLTAIESYNSQTIPTFALKMGGTNIDQVVSSAMDEDGNLYLIGNFTGTSNLSPSGASLNYTASNIDLFITRIDKNNNWNWTRVLSSSSTVNSISAIHIVNKNKIVVGGDYGGSLYFRNNPSTAGTLMGSSAAGNDAFILEIDSLGQNQHFKTFNSNSRAEVKSITSDAAGHLFIAGDFRNSFYYETFANGGTAYNSSGQHDFFYAKLDLNYDVVQHAEFGSSYEDYANTIKLDDNGDIIITGTFAVTVDFDPGVGVSNLTANGTVDVTNSDMFVLKLTNSGDFVWAKQISGTTNIESPKSALVDDNNAIYVTGQFANTVDFDPGSGVYNLVPVSGQPNSGSAGFLLKLDVNGDFVFAKSFGGYNTHTSNVIRKDAEGNIYVAGNYSNAIFFAQSGSPFNLVSNGGSDVFACKFDENGNIIWTHSVGGSNLDLGKSLEIKPDTSLVLMGDFSTTVNFVPLATPFFNFTSLGNTDIFIQYVFQCEAPSGPASNTDVGNLEICQFEQTTLSVFANNDPNLQLVWGPAGTFTSIGNGDTIVTNSLNANLTYYAFYESLCGKSDTTFFEVIVNPAPSTSGNASFDVCLNENIVFDEFIVTNSLSVLSENNLPNGITSNYVNDTLYLIGAPTESGTFNYNIEMNSLCYVFNVGGTITVNSPTTNVSQQMGAEFPYLTVSQAGATYQWIDCNNGNAPINGANSKNFYPSSPGSYAVIVTFNGCTDQSACFQFGTTSKVEENNSIFSIYPNPTRDNITLQFKEASNFKIYAIDGKLIESMDKVQINHIVDCSKYPSGIYFIKAGNQTQKFIKE
jgi:hypothetical protein